MTGGTPLDTTVRPRRQDLRSGSRHRHGVRVAPFHPPPRDKRDPNPPSPVAVTYQLGSQSETSRDYGGHLPPSPVCVQGFPRSSPDARVPDGFCRGFGGGHGRDRRGGPPSPEAITLDVLFPDPPGPGRRPVRPVQCPSKDPGDGTRTRGLSRDSRLPRRTLCLSE